MAFSDVHMVSTWYFEPSAINAFAEGRTVQDAVATRAFQEVRGRRWVISLGDFGHLGTGSRPGAADQTPLALNRAVALVPRDDR